MHSIHKPLALIALVAVSASGGENPGLTSVPPVYLMHYTPDAARSVDFVEKIRLSPPDILHLGHAVPLNSIFGPTADYSGFNPKLVPPEEILSRKDELRKFVTLLHQAGVRHVIPYINPSILGGDHLTCKGFFDFYDHWDNYSALGIGPKPARSPELWMQRDRRSFAPWEPEPNYPHWRYEPCPNEPAWCQYQRAVVRLIAESGFDGTFVDDCIMECHHDLCAQRFTEFLQARYAPKALRKVFGSDLTLGKDKPPGAADSVTRLRTAETCLFWQESMTDLLAGLARAGRETNPDFFVVPNWGASARVGGAGSRIRSGKSASVWRRAANLQLFEEDHPAGYAGPRDVISYLLQYNYGLALGIRPAMLSYGTTRGHVELGYAEAAAGGGGPYVESTAAYPEVRKKWRAFFEANCELFAGFSLTAPVGLVFSIDEPRYGNDKHLREVFALSRAFYAMHIPFAVVPVENLDAAQLMRHKVLAAPWLQHLSDDQLAQLKKFVRSGGRLLTDGGCGVRDLLDSPRHSAFAEASVSQVDRMPPHFHTGKGGVVLLNSFEELVPQREFALVDTLEVRDQSAFAARLLEICSRTPDLEGEKRFRQWFTSMAEVELSLVEEARDVHTVTYERFGDQEGSLIIHAVRYAAPTSGTGASVIQPAPLLLDVPLPSGWELQKALVRRPEGPPELVKPRVDRSTVRCELPAFDFYSMLELQLKRIARTKQAPR